MLTVWRANGLKPHSVETFKVSRDPKFAEKLEDIVGLYMVPPEHALVPCCFDPSQVQALDRTQPGLPLKKGRAATMTHDYKRHGTTTLFAALSTLDGSVISRCAQRHRHTEWLEFLRQTPKEQGPSVRLTLSRSAFGVVIAAAAAGDDVVPGQDLAWFIVGLALATFIHRAEVYPRQLQ